MSLEALQMATPISTNASGATAPTATTTTTET